MSWFDFAKRAVSAAGILEADISPIQTEDWPTPAARPKYSVLSNEKLIAAGIPKMPNLDSALRRFTDRLNQPEPTA
jgi:dTDP-4-dehydrorhamnose reductase